MVIRFEKQSVIDIISSIIIWACIVNSFVPQISAYINVPMLNLFLSFFWIVINTIYRPHIMGIIIYKYGMYLLLMLYLVLFPYVFGYPYIGNRYISLFSFWWGVVVFTYYSLSEKMKSLKIAVYCTIPFMLIVLYRTIRSGLENPWNIRQINTFGSGELSDRLIMSGIGGYEFIYSSLFFAILLLIVFYKTGTKQKVFSGILMGCIVLEIILSNFLTAIVMLVAGCAAFLMIYTSKRNAMLFISFNLALFIIVMFFDDSIIGWLSGLFNTKGRIYRVFSGNRIGIFSEFVSDRLPLLKISFYSIMESPILGRIPFEKGLYDDIYVAISNHSTILDTCALYGLPLGLMFLKMILIPFKNYKIYKRKEYKYSFLIPFLLFIFLNNTTDAIANSITLVIPFLLTALASEKKNET